MPPPDRVPRPPAVCFAGVTTGSAPTQRCSPVSPPSAAARPAGPYPARLTATGPRRATAPIPSRCSRPRRQSRVQELVPIRYGRMLVSPFTFYRGAAAVMAADLAATPDSGIVVQACGDAHISNFGGFAAPDRRLVFSPNDFDETLPGPWEWDVKRMAASAEIAGRDVGLPADRRRRIVTACVREYREAMRQLRRAKATSTCGTSASTRASSSIASAGSWARRAGSCSPSRSPRRGARRACGRSRSSPSASTASCASAASRRCSFRCASC